MHDKELLFKVVVYRSEMQKTIKNEKWKNGCININNQKKYFYYIVQ